MNDRISIKGRGDELFFNNEKAASPIPAPQEQEPARQTDSLVAEKTAGMPDRKTERQTARQTDHPQPIWSADAVHAFRHGLSDEHPVHNTFRYSQQSLDAVRDIVYELEVKRGIKTSRNDVMRLGLAWIIDDYTANGADSLLVAVLKEEKWKPNV